MLVLSVLFGVAVGAVPSPGLRDLTHGRLYVGSAVNYGYLTGTGNGGSMSPAEVSNYTAVITGEFNIITAENALKMKQTEPARGVFNFTEGDAIVKLAAAHNITVRGHNLVWCAHNPMWVPPFSKTATEAEMDGAMKAHITGVAAHYRGQVYSWDVVNEGIVDVPKVHSCSNWTCALKGKDHMPRGDDAVDWTKAGIDYIPNAFRCGFLPRLEFFRLCSDCQDQQSSCGSMPCKGTPQTWTPLPSFSTTSTQFTT
eukprot:m.100041 g.100041  ORF g.100041 m.100041 type:complete len:255 (+) comp20648_c0_seq1:149-913(+)